MKVSVEWLKKYVDFNVNCDELVNTLPMLGLEVEELSNESEKNLNNVVVGEVITKEPHPEADRLSVCSVKVDNSMPPSTIVCGAKNFDIGDRVPVALPGAKLPGGFKIKKSKLRGVPSEGMMCSESELELGSDDTGLMILQGKPEIGKSIKELFQNDVTLDLEITANRGDCLSHIGVAREIAAYYEKELRMPETSVNAEKVKEPSSNNLVQSVSVLTENCPFYTLWAIKGVKIGPSPEWLVKRLESVGARSVNNVVDITNFVLFETGQPLHAFDADKINGNEIIVRQANQNEEIVTLDGEKRVLDDSMMVIADRVSALVVAGVMGSVEAEVDDNTTNIILEAAYFKPGNIRSTSRMLGLHSDSSQRFTRDVDPAGVDYAAKRAIDLILEIAGGNCVPELVCIGNPPRSHRHIEINQSFVEEKCGFDVKPENLVDCWKRLGFEVEGQNPWKVGVPSFRSEVDRPIDLVEEYIRIRGTNDLENLQLSLPILSRENDSSYDFIEKAIDNLCGQGFQEVCNYSLRSENEIKTCFPELNLDSIRLNNPLTADHTHVRPSLIPGLIDSLANNQKNLCPLKQVFETGRVFQAGPRGNVELLSIAFASLANSGVREWRKVPGIDFFDIKRVLIRLLHALGISSPKNSWESITQSSLWQQNHAAVKGNVHQNKLQISAGTLSLKVTKEKGLKGCLLAVEILVDPILLTKKKKVKTFSSFTSFPPAIKDLSLVVDASEPGETVRSKLESIAKEVIHGKFELDDVSIFDLFSGDGLLENQKSVACCMRFRSHERTLGEKEVNDVFEKIVKNVEQETNYNLRT
jgi:phenylalanyl-tRNA synthetase beta chain